MQDRWDRIPGNELEVLNEALKRGTKRFKDEDNGHVTTRSSPVSIQLETNEFHRYGGEEQEEGGGRWGGDP